MRYLTLVHIKNRIQLCAATNAHKVNYEYHLPIFSTKICASLHYYSGKQNKNFSNAQLWQYTPLEKFPSTSHIKCSDSRKNAFYMKKAHLIADLCAVRDIIFHQCVSGSQVPVACGLDFHFPSTWRALSTPRNHAPTEPSHIFSFFSFTWRIKYPLVSDLDLLFISPFYPEL